MTARRHLLAVALLGCSFAWLFWRAVDLASVSPVHWPLLLPRIVLEGVPAMFGGATALALVLGRRAVKALALLFAASAGYAVILAYVTPEIRGRYVLTVRQAQETWAHPQSTDRF